MSESSTEIFELSETHSIQGEGAAESAKSEAPENKTELDADQLLLTADEELLAQLESIPDKMAFKIGEVAELVGVKQYVLRYWETEFDVLRPKKSNHNQRMYRRKDVETVMMIKKLLYKDKFSISGARAVIKKLKTKVKPGSVSRESFRKQNDVLMKAKQFVQKLAALESKI